jgi:arylsulfatase A-like enzyme
VGATVFTEAYGVSSWTKPSVASLFTGVYPGAHGVTGNIYPLPDEAVTLAEVMRDGGYRTICVSANPNVTRSGHMDAGFDIMDDVMHGPVFNAVGPPTSCMRPLLGFVALRPLLGPLFVLSTDGVKVNARLAFWSRFVGDRPVFYYVHYMEPHIPNLPRPEYYYEYQPYMVKVDPARLETVASGPFYWDEFLKDPDFKVPLTPDEVALAKALYDADIRRMDVVIEGLLENIVGGSDGEAESIVVITADHGEEFLEHRRWMHGAGMHHEVARIPLIVKAPDGRPGRVDGLVNLLDIPVTLASYAGLDAPAAWEGLDLRPFIAAGGELPRRELLLEGLHTILPPSEADGLNADIELNGLVSGDYYYLRDENAGVEYLYNRRRDRWERENLAAGGPGEEAAAILTRSRDAVDRSKAEVAESAFGREEMELTPALKRQLKSIGYLK